jgi:ketosteroid isomerase-like protein
MGHPNEDLVRRGYDAFSRGDMQTLRELFTLTSSGTPPAAVSWPATTRALTRCSATSARQWR